MLTPTQIQVHVARKAQAQQTTQHEYWEHLLLRRAPDEPVYPRLWQVVTGTIDDGETAVQTAFRELQEETGLHVEELWVLPYVGSFFDVGSNAFAMIPCFAAVVDAADAHVHLSTEHSDYLWLALEQATAQLVMPSHIEGTRVFQTYVLGQIDTAPFRRVRHSF
jgi:dATP pyrophosphohydrolase